MKSSNIGGQAVLEGIMMKNGSTYAVGVRKPDGEIEVVKDTFTSIIPIPKLTKIPFIRGAFNFIDSMVLGMKSLNISASFYDEEEDISVTKKEQQDRKNNFIMGLTMLLSVSIGICIFMVLPYGIIQFLSKWITSKFIQVLLEGMIRIGIFIAYILVVSQMEDIKRTFMYHGAEHKCINCIESGWELNVANVAKSSKQHRRCGTSFIFFVLLVSMLCLFFINVESIWLRVVVRIVILPFIAGISFELIKWAGNSRNWFINLISVPGLWMQELTTKEPTDDMIEVAIASVEAVFDWQAYLQGEAKE